jgi:hypothetical protein
MMGCQNSISYLSGHLADEIRRLSIVRSQIHPDDSDRSRGEMKTRKTTFVAVLSQTLTTTSTFTTTSRVYSEGGNPDYDFKNGEGNALTTATTPLGGSAHRWCVECATPMAMMSPELAATVCFQTTRAIYRLVEAGRVHFTDGPEGVMVCPASLMKDWAGEQIVGFLTAAPAPLAGLEIKRP